MPGRLPLRSPLPPFGCSGSLLGGPPAGASCPKPASGSGLSLARNDCPFPGHHNEVAVPGLPLPRHARTPRKPLIGNSSSPGGLHPPGSGSWRPTRFSVAYRALPAAPRISTPLQGFRSLRIEASNDLLPKSLPSGFARLPFAPRHALYF